MENGACQMYAALSDDQEGYHCIDGHKRLSAIYDILQQNPKERHFQSIKAINHGNARTQPPQCLQNHH